MDVGFSLPTVGPVGEREYLLQLAQAADRLGFHSVWASDHVVFPKERRSEYPYARSTTGGLLNAGVQWLDPIAAMGFVAGATERVEIGTSVLVLPYRNPVVLANEVASLDRLSGGRIVLGIGVGWMDEEFAALGVPKRERGPRTDEYVAVLRTLWSGRSSFEGKFVRFADVVLATEPLRQGGPPIYVGGNAEPALLRAGRLGDGWLGFEVFSDEVPEARGVIERAAKDAGRDPTSLVLSVRRGLLPPFEVTDFLPERRSVSGTAREIADELHRYEAAGVGLVVFDLAMLPDEMVRTMEWFASEVGVRMA